VGCTRDVGSGEFAGVFLHDGTSWSSRSNVGDDAAWRCAGVVAHVDGYRVESDSGNYGEVVHAYGQADVPISEARAVEDARRLAASSMLGLLTGDWTQGTVAAQRVGPAVAGTRPAPVAYRNTNLIGAATVAAFANTEAARQAYLVVDAVMEAGPNLALELYDLIDVDWPWLGWQGRRLRVHRLVEVWERGRMGQRLYCGLV
jgi:hypothetical protein